MHVPAAEQDVSGPPQHSLAPTIAEHSSPTEMQDGSKILEEGGSCAEAVGFGVSETSCGEGVGCDPGGS